MVSDTDNERKRRWYAKHRAETADEREHHRRLKNAAPAARGLPDDLKVAFLSINPDGSYDGWASEPLTACADRGLIDRLEECGSERRAILTGWGEAVREVLQTSPITSEDHHE